MIAKGLLPVIVLLLAGCYHTINGVPPCQNHKGAAYFSSTPWGYMGPTQVICKDGHIEPLQYDKDGKVWVDEKDDK